MTASLSEIGESPRERVSVLHVDDDPGFRDLTAAYLGRLDDRIDVTTAVDPSAGLEVLESRAIDCVISDYQMPGLTGVEFLLEVRETYPNLPFVLFTGRGSEDVASEAIDAGVSSYVRKGGPESYEQLVNRIRNAVGKRRSELRAEVASERLLALYEQTDGFFILDSDWTITYWNRRIAERTGRSEKEVLGERFGDVFPEAADTDLAEQYRTAMERGEPVEFETLYEPHGYWVAVRAYPVEGGLFVHSRNISEEKAQARELERRNQILESFASTVSHDLRNPLNVAEGKLELARETGDLDHLEAVAQAHDRMRNLVDELLRLAGGDDPPIQALSLADLATEAWETVPSGAADLRVEGDAQFEAQRSQLHRLFENLFWNAIEHGDATTVRVGRDGDGCLYVEDDGSGIDEADRAAVFETGFSTAEDSPGYGLSIVRGIVEAHGWEISIAEGDGVGARFEIRGIDLSEPDSTSAAP